jgi:hypothetical protein
VRESHTITLNESFDRSRHQIRLGIYRAGNSERLTVYDPINGEELGTAWTVDSE